MKKSDWSCLILGFLLTAVACKPVTEDERKTIEPAPMSTLAVAQQSTATSKPDPTNLPPPLPTPEPTTNLSPSWQQIGSEETVLRIAAPPGWVNLSGRLDIPAATNRLGLTVLFLADSARTGNTLLAGKEISAGAFATGMISNLNLPVHNASAALAQLVTHLSPSVTALTQPVPITAVITAVPLQGAYVDVLGDPVGLVANGGQELRTRILLFVPEEITTPPERNRQAIFLLSAPDAVWNNYTATFERMMQAVVIHDLHARFAINEGAANVVGSLRAQDQVSGSLERGVKDVWMFTTTSGRYATVTLKPEASRLDLTLTLIGPSGQTVARIDHGYAGTTEAAVDIVLNESGLYLVEVSEFFNEPGRYVLSLILADEPLYSGGGRIEMGQVIRSELPANSQHVWNFNGTAGQPISIVLTPGQEQFDAILDLYGPDGRRLVALDEGFSGDPEVISGYQLPVTGEYAIMVRSFAGQGGAYTLSLDEGGEDTLNFYDAGDLAYSDVRRETLRANEAHAWFFDGRAGDELIIEVTPLNPGLDLDIWLLDPDIARIAAADTFLAGEAEKIEITLTRDGQYLILVRDFYGAAGEYEIRLGTASAGVSN